MLRRMVADHAVLGELLLLAASIAGTAMYSMLIRRRQAARLIVAEQAAVEASGLQGLVRVFLADHRSV